MAFSSAGVSVYPRWRGEHLCTSSMRALFCGLSPLARGTLSVSLAQIRKAVYPRWRGEHFALRLGVLKISGLSPLARGTHYAGILADGDLRFIPAGAGNTESGGPLSCSGSVYPRWRGEHIWPRLRQNVHRGLSPLARGTHSPKETNTNHVRFIPAGAGNTSSFIPSPNPFSVYPRWRGEHVISSRNAVAILGLSPLARGTPDGFFQTAA